VTTPDRYTLKIVVKRDEEIVVEPSDFLRVSMRWDGQCSIEGRSSGDEDLQKFDAIGSFTVFIDELTAARNAGVLHFGDEWDRYGSRQTVTSPDSEEVARLRHELSTLANAAVDGLLINHIFYPHNPTEPLPIAQTPMRRQELEVLRDAAAAACETFSVDQTTVARLLATIEQRDRIYAAIQTDADPAGTYRELVEGRDLIAQLSAKIAEMERDAAARDTCEHCGAALLPKKARPLCESCVPLCSDDCDHRWPDQPRDEEKA